MECTIAVAISLLTLGAALQINAQQLKLVKSTRESNASSFLLQDRVEQFRILSWQKLTDATYLRDTFIATRPPSSALLPNISEQVKLTPWPDESAGKPILVEYATGSSPRILLTGLDASNESQNLNKQRLAKVDMVVTWTGKDNRQRSRSYSSIISNSGVNRTNLPAFGGPANSGNWENFGDVPTGTPAPGSTGSTGSTPTPKPGKGKGRGDAGGTSGSDI